MGKLLAKERLDDELTKGIWIDSIIKVAELQNWISTITSWYGRSSA